MKTFIKSFLCGGLLLCSCALWAVPARKVLKIVQQPDGTELQLRLMGDEHLRYYQTLDGIPVAEANGAYYYATLQNNVLKPVNNGLAHMADGRSASEVLLADSLKKSFQKQMPQAYRARKLAQDKRAASQTANRSFGGQALPNPMTGKKKGLVILVNFKDVSMKTPNAHRVFSRMMNEPGYQEHMQHGSVRDYFLSQSYGQFDFSFDVVGPVTLPYPMEYYGRNLDGFDLRPGEMALDACMLIRDSVDFRNYDWNGDHETEQIFVVYAGYAESNGASANTIWPHQSYIQNRDGSDFVVNGITIGKYACSSELTGTSGTTLTGIGTMCHEFSHCFGIPDFYDVYGVNFGLDAWSLMDYGCYNDNGNTPIGYTSYERMMCGWLNPIVLKDSISITDMPCLSDEPVAYAIQNDANEKEYYLLENRQQRGWDSFIKDHGMLVLHVDYDERAWEFNMVNTDAKRLRMSYIAADNKKNASSLTGDLFPGVYGVTELTDSSSPAALLNGANMQGAKRMSKPIYNIKEENELLSFDFLKKKASGIAELLHQDTDNALWQVFCLDGRCVGQMTMTQLKCQLPAGIYLLRSKSKTRKITIH